MTDEKSDFEKEIEEETRQWFRGNLTDKHYFQNLDQIREKYRN